MSASAAWGDRNVLTYLYESKEHKALRYNRRIESIYHHYNDKLTNPKEELLKKEQAILNAEVERRNAAYDALEMKRKEARILKERETKLFQDKQKDSAHLKVKEERDTKQLDAMMIQKNFEAYNAEEASKRKQIRTKHMEHIKHVKNQMREEPRNFAKTGIAIIQTSDI